MTTKDSTTNKAVIENQLAKKFPINTDPYSVWFNDEAVGRAKWVVNDEEGMAIVESPNYEAANKIANALRVSEIHENKSEEFATNRQLEKEEESRRGAMACLNAMRIIERIENAPNLDGTIEDYWRDKEAGTTAMLHASGVQSGFLAGFVTSFAEYVSFVESAGTPDLYHWKPEAAMKDEEKEIHRVSLQSSYDEDEAEASHG